MDRAGPGNVRHSFEEAGVPTVHLILAAVTAISIAAVFGWSVALAATGKGGGRAYQTPLGRCQPGALDRGQARDDPAVDSALRTPKVDGLGTDAKVAGEIGDTPTGYEQIEYASSDLGRISTSSQGCLLCWTAA